MASFQVDVKGTADDYIISSNLSGSCICQEAYNSSEVCMHTRTRSFAFPKKAEKQGLFTAASSDKARHT